MRAILFDQYGPPECLRLGVLPRPSCGPDQVLIQVRAAGVNPLDWKVRSGSLRLFVRIRFPAVPGYEVSGRVAEAGSEAAKRGWKVGDEVFCYLKSPEGGGYAEFVPADAGILARKPSDLTHEEAAGVPLAATTAWQALHDLGRLQPGQNVLVNGASGGVGTFAVQLAKAQGANVTGVCSGKNVDLVRDLGADRTIDYAREDFTSLEEKYDIVFDAAAKRSYPACRPVLTPRGRYITTLPSAQGILYQALTKLTGRRCLIFVARPRGEDLQAIAQLIEGGQVRPVVDEVLPLESAAEAHRKSESGHVRGKLVLRVT